jgi:putative transposase
MAQFSVKINNQRSGTKPRQVQNTSYNGLLRRPVESAQFTSEQFQWLLADNGITCSMSRAGNVWGNSAMKSFFSSLKTERTARKVWPT